MTVAETEPGKKTGEDALSPLFAEARQAWPALKLETELLRRYVEQRGIDPGTISAARALDLFLVVACEAQLPGAIEAFQRAYHAVIESAARTFDASPEFGDEVKQRVSEALFVGTKKSPPRIGQYRANGPLAAWVRTCAKRSALRLAGNVSLERLVSGETLANEIAEECDQELALFKAYYGQVFRDALTSALRALPPRQRMLLYLNLIAGVSTTRIGKMYRLNQSSISRQLKVAASSTFEILRKDLSAQLGVVTDELHSLLDMVRSRIELSLTLVDELEEGPVG